jgi:hypothetical protein
VNDERRARRAGIHDHQPIGSLDDVAEAAARASRPFRERLAARPEVKVWTSLTMRAR